MIGVYDKVTSMPVTRVLFIKRTNRYSKNSSNKFIIHLLFTKY